MQGFATLHEAIDEAKYCSVRRRMWPEGLHVSFHPYYARKTGLPDGYAVQIDEMSGRVVPYHLTYDDVLADDWEPYQ